MELHIVPVTAENRAAVLNLHVAPAQLGFIETTAQCLAEADELLLWRPVGIYDGGTPVGFAMYGLFPNEGPRGRVWLDRLLVDERYQGRHYGTAALSALLRRLQDEYGCGEVYLSLYDGNLRARELYKRFGFVFNGERDINGERVMVKPL